MKNKLFITIIMLLLVVILFTACNRTVFDTKSKFTKAHICVDGEWFDVDVEKWCDYDGEQIQLILTDGSVIVIHSRDCILYEGTLPKGENQ